MTARTRLGRGARGLPRYYMDVGWYRHPTFAGLPIEALFVFEACIGYCHEHGTDGRLPGHHEDLAVALGLRASDVRKALKALVERQIVTVDNGQAVIAGYVDHNPSAEEIRQHSKERSQSGSIGNHKRWHVGRGIVDPDCPHCTPTDDTDSDRSSDDGAIAGANRSASHGMGWDGMGSSSLVSTGSTGDDHPPADDDEDPRQQLIHRIAQRVVERRQANSKTTITNPDRWRATVLASLRNDPAWWTDLERIVDTHMPDTPIDLLAQAADGNPSPNLRFWRDTTAQAS